MKYISLIFSRDTRILDPGIITGLKINEKHKRDKIKADSWYWMPAHDKIIFSLKKVIIITPKMNNGVEIKITFSNILLKPAKSLSPTKWLYLFWNGLNNTDDNVLTNWLNKKAREKIATELAPKILPIAIVSSSKYKIHIIVTKNEE